MNGYSPKDFCDFIDAPVSSNEPPADIPTENGNDSFLSESTYCDSDRRTESNNLTSKHTLPEVLLFKDGTGVRITDTAEQLGDIYEKKEILFFRVTGNGNVSAHQIQILDKCRNLKILASEAACSEFEKVARISIFKKHKFIHAVFKKADADRILNCDIFINKLPPIKIITKCPVIVETADGDTKIINNYDRDSGIFAMGEKPQIINVDDAVEIILSSIDEFIFKSPADKSRAVASIITPALIMSGIGNIRSPIHLVEADESQAGKGFLTRVSAAYYNEIRIL
jgi:hypothetical protein